MTKKQIAKVKKLSDLYWETVHHPRSFTFWGYYKNFKKIIKLRELIKKHEAWNLRVRFTNFCDDCNTFEVGESSFNLGIWNFGFTEQFIKDLIDLVGNLYFWVDESDGFCLKINKDLKIVSMVGSDGGGG